jgi:hypothetical protein
MLHKVNTFLAIEFILVVALLPILASIRCVNADSEVTILSYDSYIDTVGFFHVVGEVQNTGTVALRYVEIIATFYNSSGVVVATDFTFADLSTVHVGEKSPFDILFTDETQIPKIDHYSLITDYSTGTPLTPALRMLSNSSYTDTSGFMHIVGEIQNDGVSRATFVEVLATLYDSGGNVVLTDFTFTDPSDIDPGEKAPFDILVTVEDRIPLVDSYSLNAQSNQYSLVPELSANVLIILIVVSLSVGTLFLRKKLLKIQNYRLT